jgi:hypothetical protein
MLLVRMPPRLDHPAPALEMRDEQVEEKPDVFVTVKMTLALCAGLKATDVTRTGEVVPTTKVGMFVTALIALVTTV